MEHLTLCVTTGGLVKAFSPAWSWWERKSTGGVYWGQFWRLTQIPPPPPPPPNPGEKYNNNPKPRSPNPPTEKPQTSTYRILSWAQQGTPTPAAHCVHTCSRRRCGRSTACSRWERLKSGSWHQRLCVRSTSSHGGRLHAAQPHNQWAESPRWTRVAATGWWQSHAWSAVSWWGLGAWMEALQMDGNVISAEVYLIKAQPDIVWGTVWHQADKMFLVLCLSQRKL